MIEIIALFFIAHHIGIIAEKKGLKPLTWKIYAILGWIGAELIGFVVGLMFFRPDDFVSLVIVGFIFGFTGFLLVKKKLDSMPDVDDEQDIDQIGKW